MFDLHRDEAFQLTSCTDETVKLTCISTAGPPNPGHRLSNGSASDSWMVSGE